jgi:hypothetical protein
MGSLVWIGFVVFFIVSLLVGVRLLLLWWRTRQLPELLIGIGVLGIGPVGFGLPVAAGLFAQPSPDLAPVLVGLGALAVSIAATAKLTFNWRVYHPQSRALGLIPIAAAPLLLAAFLVEWAMGGFAVADPAAPTTLIRTFLQVACLLWGSAEALRYWTMMRRRVRLGLGDPVVTNRFLLWGIGAGAAGVGSFIGIAAQIATGSSTGQIPWVMTSSSLHGLVAAIALWFAFVPPVFYRRYIQERASRSAVA